MSQLLSSLNTEQQKAVQATSGPLLIFAGAGSGKTRTLTHRIAHLIHEEKVKPWNILAVTFTNKAAMEMKQRLHGLLSEKTQNALLNENNIDLRSSKRDFFANHEKEFTHLPLVGTFHSVCVRILRKDIEKLGRKRDFVIYDTVDTQSLMRQMIKDFGIDEKQFHYKAVLSQISKAKNELVDPKTFANNFVHNMYSQTISHLYTEYEKRLFANNALDFDGLIFHTIALFQNFTEVLDYYQDRWLHISVDEYQDTNVAQYRLIQMLAEKYRNLCVIGDNDQSIYSFRGADMRNILNFEKDNPDATVIKLEQNYRSTKNIIDASDHVIAKNKDRPAKHMWTDKEEGDKVCMVPVFDEREEAENIAKEVLNRVHSEDARYADFVLLYRTNAQSRMLEEAMVRNAIPYRVIGGVKFYARKEIKDILAYLRVIKNPMDMVSMLRIINVPARKIGQKTLDILQQWAEQQGYTFWDALNDVENIPSLSKAAKNNISVFTGLIKQFQDMAKEITVADLIEKVIRKSGYYDFIMDGTEEGKVRYENILELISVAQKYSGLIPWDSLTYFLEEVALVADADSIEDEPNSILLMTIHTAKGLEFPYVFVAGCEDNIFPHSRSILDEAQVEEERRLMYVAMTRAQKRLYLLYANRRMIYGDVQMNRPSRFLYDIPDEVLDRNPLKGDHHETDLPSFSDEYHSEPPVFESQVEQSALEEGDRVYHQVFGEGTILKKQGDVVEIRFDSARVGMRKFAANIAPLQKL